MRDLIISTICMLIIIIPWGFYDKFAADTVENYKSIIKEEILPAIEDDDWDTAEKRFAFIAKDWDRYKQTICVLYRYTVCQRSRLLCFTCVLLYKAQESEQCRCRNCFSGIQIRLSACKRDTRHGELILITEQKHERSSNRCKPVRHIRSCIFGKPASCRFALV